MNQTGVTRGAPLGRTVPRIITRRDSRYSWSNRPPNVAILFANDGNRLDLDKEISIRETLHLKPSASRWPLSEILHSHLSGDIGLRHIGHVHDHLYHIV